jgi:hypothetical protein
VTASGKGIVTRERLASIAKLESQAAADRLRKKRERDLDAIRIRG